MSGNERYKLPENVNEAAALLLSDLLVQHLQTLSDISEENFDRLCDRVSPYLAEEFRLWQGNAPLLDSCYANLDCQETDPGRIILNRAKQMLHEFQGFLIIT